MKFGIRKIGCSMSWTRYSFLICIRTHITINTFSDNLQTSQSLHSCRFFSLKVLSVIGRKWDCSVIIKIGDSKNLSVTSSEIQHLLHKYFFTRKVLMIYYPRSDLFLNLSLSHQYFSRENSFNPVPTRLFHVIYYHGDKKVSLPSV